MKINQNLVNLDLFLKGNYFLINFKIKFVYQ